MSLFAGIDLNSNVVDIVLLDEDTNEAHWIRRRIDTGPAGDDAFARCRRLRDAMPARSIWKDSGVVAIGLEIGMSKSFKSVRAQGRVQGAILACLPVEIPVYELYPASWKRLALGSGRATKEDGAAWCRRNVRWLENQRLPQDAIDAACIAKAAEMRHLLEGSAAA